MPRPFRFGMVFTHGADTAGFADLARGAEDDGFSTLLVADHLDNPMACGPLLMAAADFQRPDLDGPVSASLGDDWDSVPKQTCRNDARAVGYEEDARSEGTDVDDPADETAGGAHGHALANAVAGPG